MTDLFLLAQEELRFATAVSTNLVRPRPSRAAGETGGLLGNQHRIDLIMTVIPKVQG